jgi:hypothetical protein
MKTIQSIVVALSVVTLAIPAFASSSIPDVSTQSVQAAFAFPTGTAKNPAGTLAAFPTGTAKNPAGTLAAFPTGTAKNPAGTLAAFPTGTAKNPAGTLAAFQTV